MCRWALGQMATMSPFRHGVVAIGGRPISIANGPCSRPRQWARSVLHSILLKPKRGEEKFSRIEFRQGVCPPSRTAAPWMDNAERTKVVSMNRNRQIYDNCTLMRLISLQKSIDGRGNIFHSSIEKPFGVRPDWAGTIIIGLIFSPIPSTPPALRSNNECCNLWPAKTAIGRYRRSQIGRGVITRKPGP